LIDTGTGISPSASSLRSLLAEPHYRPSRCGTGACHCQGDRRGARRAHPGRKRDGRGKHVFLHPSRVLPSGRSEGPRPRRHYLRFGSAGEFSSLTADVSALCSGARAPRRRKRRVQAPSSRTNRVRTLQHRTREHPCAPAPFKHGIGSSSWVAQPYAAPMGLLGRT
jgi:hypothetical protein